MEQRVSFKVYYEDTDSLGVVYYANYFKFMERGRTEFVGAHGRSVAQWNAEGVLLVVHSVQAQFKKPAVLGDLIDVVSSFSVVSAYRGRFTQRLTRAATGELCVDATVDIVCLDTNQNLIELPAGLRELAS